MHAVGKVDDLFAGVGIDHAHPGATNAEALGMLDAARRGARRPGSSFANLIETDQVYGHRKDVEGFHAALREIDAAVARLARAAGRRRPARPHRRPRRATRDGRTPTTRASACRCWPRFAGDGGRRHDGPMADVGASVAALADRPRDPLLPGDPFV